MALSGLVLATVIRVPADFPTIQQGLDALSSGDTVLVANGEYAEALLAPPITFWLLGDVPVDTGDFARPVIDASLTPDSVDHGCLILPEGSAAFVERIRFRNRHDMVPRGVRGGVDVAADSASFSYCSFDSCFAAITQTWQDSSVGFVEISHCAFRDYLSNVHVPFTTSHISDCLFSNVNYGWVLQVGTGAVVENCQFKDTPGICVATYYHRDVTIRNCVFGPFIVPNTLGIIDLRFGQGTLENNVFAHIQSLYMFVESQSDEGLEARIAGNTFLDCDNVPNNQGWYLLYVHTWGDNPQTGYSVEDNVFADCTLGSWGRGILAKGKGTLRRNRISDVQPAPQHSGPAVYCDTVGSIIFRENLFYDNGYALSAAEGVPVDARWNWWGHSTGPFHPTQNPVGLGDEVGFNVDFAPWYPDTAFLSVPDYRQPLPDQFTLDAYPNPFNNTVTLTLVPSQAAIVQVELFDILGRCVQEIWKGPLAFEKQVTFDGRDLASGIYFARVWQPIGNRSLALAKLVLMK